MADFEVVDAPERLKELAGQFLAEPVLAVDTEADSFYHYFDKTCLVQIATSKHSYLIDTLAFDGLSNKLREAGHAVTRPQNGFLPGYLRLIAIGAVALGLLVFWIT